MILFFGICINVNAQGLSNKEVRGIKGFIDSPANNIATEKSSKESRGDKYFFRYAFDKAIESYTSNKQLTTEGQRRLAESNHNIGQEIQAEAAYLKLINGQANLIPEDYFNYATVLKNNGKNSESNIQMDKFYELKPNDLRAQDYAANKGEFVNMSKDDGKYKIKQLTINSDADDFGASYYKNMIVFASTKETPKMIKRRYNWTGKPFWDIYVSEIKDGQLKKAKKFNNNMNDKLHDGPASFSNDGTFMAFTRNNYKDKSDDKVVELQIYFSTYTNDKWSKPEPFALNNSAYQVGQPCLTPDGNTMYFTSDMPGGFGGADIYRVTKSGNGLWGKAENLGNKVNTEGDEMFPYFEKANSVLFFSSNGRFGLGGLDIFYCSVNGSEVGRVKNAGSPLNTPYDDFSVIVDNKLNQGYFASNRSGGSGGDDIYAFDILKSLDIDKKIQGIAQDKNGMPINETFVMLLDDQGFLIDSATTENDGAFNFLVATNNNFRLIGKSESYLDGVNVANTFGKESIVTADLVLLQKEKEIVVVEKIEVIPEKIKVKIENLNPIYFDLDKFNIRPDAEVELKKIVKIMNDNPEMVVELSSYTDCRASKEYNQILSENMALASVNYIKSRITKPERISGKGFGETMLVNLCAGEGDVVSTCSEPEHQMNRRTEFVIEK